MSRQALVVGINRYPLLKNSPTKQPRHLLKPATDAEAIAQILETYGNFRVQRLPEIVDHQGRWRVNPEPHARQLPKVEHLKQAISQLLNPPSNPPQTALLFFAGHGVLEETGGIKQGYLATSDAKPPKNWGVSFHWLSQLLKNSPVQQIIIWLDCCYSGALLNLSEVDPGIMTGKKDLCFIAACRDFEVAYEEFGGEHGVLTGALLSALNPENQGEGWVTNYSLIDGLKKELAKTKQSPVFHNLGGEIVLTGERKQLERAILMAEVCPYKGLEPFAFNDQDPKLFYGRTRLTDELLDRVRVGNFLAVLGASGSGKSSVVKAGLLYQLKLGQRVSGSETLSLIIFRPGEHPLKNLAQGLSKFCGREIQVNSAEELRGVIADIKQEKNTQRVVLVVDQFEEVFTLCDSLEEREQFFDCVLGALDSLKLTDQNPPKPPFGRGADQNPPKPPFGRGADQNPPKPPFGRGADQNPPKPPFGRGADQDPPKPPFGRGADQNPPKPPLGKGADQDPPKPSIQEKIKSSGRPRTSGDGRGIKEKINSSGRPRTSVDGRGIDENSLTVIITMRSDFFGKCTEREYAGLSKKIQDNLVSVTPMKVSELREAIIQPAYHVGLEVQRELVEQILADVSGTGSLPLMQYTLTELWRSRQVNRLTLAAYTKLGGVKGTLQKRAEQVYKELSDDEQLAAKRIFLELTQLGEGTEDTRRQIYQDELVNEHQSRELVEKTLKKLTDARLLVASELQARGNENEKPAPEAVSGQQTVTAIDVAHEALIRHWPRLQSWLNENRAAIRIERKIEADGSDWDSNGKPNHDLLTGSRLVEAENYLQEYGELGLLSALGKEYIEKSIRQRNMNRLIRYCAVAGVVGIVSIFGVVATIFGLEAKKSERKAQENAIEAEALVAAKFEPNPVKGLTKAIELTGRSQKLFKKNLPLVYYSLSETAQAIRERQQLKGLMASVSSVAITPDGTKIVSGSGDNTIRVWDFQGNELAVLKGHESSVNSVAITGDGTKIVSGSRDNTIRVWDFQGNELAVLKGLMAEVRSVAITGDGTKIVFGSGDNTIRVWDFQGKELAVLTGHEDDVIEVAITGDGTKIVSGSLDNTIRVWDLQGQELAVLTGHEDDVISVAITGDGTKIVSGSLDNTIRVWDLQGQELEVLTGHDHTVSSVAITGDGTKIVFGSGDNTIRVWDLQGKELAVLKGLMAEVRSVAITGDGTKIVFGSGDNTIRVWDFQGQELEVLTGHEDDVIEVAITGDGTKIVSGSLDNTIRVWDLQGQELEVLTGHEDYVISVAITPDGTKIVSGSSDKTIRVWDFQGQELEVLEGHELPVPSVAITGDGTKIVSGSWDNTIRVWDFQGQELEVLTGHEDYVISVAITPDGNKIVSGSSDNTIRVWDFQGNELAVLKGHEDDVISVAITGDGTKIVSGSLDNTIRVWDFQGKELAVLKGHEDDVISVAITGDGTKIVSGSLDKTIRVWPLSWQSWLNLGCDRLRSHPVFVEAQALSLDNPEEEEHKIVLDAVKTCEEQEVDGKPIWSKPEKAQLRVRQGLAIARLTGDFAAAKEKFEQAQQLDAEFYQSLGYDPEVKAKELMASVLVSEGEKIAGEGKLEEAIAKFQSAKTLDTSNEFDPEAKAKPLVAASFVAKAASYMQQDKPESALAKYQKAQKLDAQLEQADQWDLNRLCWQGSLLGYATEVMTACEIAVQRNPDNGAIRDSRGVARALTGDYSGAIEDFEVYIKELNQWIENTDDEDYRQDLETTKAQRQGWIDTLNKGENPFTEEVLQELLQE